MLRNTKSIGIKMDTPLDVLTSHVCTICFSNETHTLKCADNFCTTRVCEDCFKVYLGHCLSEKSLVKCLNQYCKSYIVSNSFKPYNDYFELYKKVLVTAFMHSQGPEVKDKMITTKMISDLRSERRKFLKQFPKAIELVVNVGMQTGSSFLCRIFTDVEVVKFINVILVWLGCRSKEQVICFFIYILIASGEHNTKFLVF